ncbi:DUF6731 family protein, partial [Ramlibacter sp.]|uniref:DUF6731 family protein n=1 Tax=Ramlibacter sp. TaxID=1917967 RepID=UPI003D128CCA
MAKEVVVTLFDVSSGDDTPPLSDIIETFQALPLEERWRADIRLDDIHKPKTLERVYFLDFARKREIGPGKLTEDRPIDDIDMEENENFGEETAAMYVGKKKWLLVLNNAVGVGPNRMMSYFNAVDPGNQMWDFNAEPVLEAHTMRTLSRMDRISTVEVTASVDALGIAGTATSLALARAARPAGAHRISFELIANERRQRGRSLDVNAVKEMVGKLVRRQAVTVLKVKGEDPDGERDIMLDLIHHRLKQRYPDT